MHLILVVTDSGLNKKSTLNGLNYLKTTLNPRFNQRDADPTVQKLGDGRWEMQEKRGLIYLNFVGFIGVLV